MCAEEFDRENFEDKVRSIAHEISESVERLAGQVDVDEFAGYVGIEADRAREWVESAASWFGSQLENLGDEVATRSRDASGRWPGFERQRPADRERPPKPEPERPVERERQRPSRREPTSGGDDPLRGAAPHPLDLPTDEQGQALAALESGRWAVESSTQRLTARGDGPAPSDALGLVRELRARDWIAADGELTLAGRRALACWLDSAQRI